MKMKKIIGKTVGAMMLCGAVVATLPMVVQAGNSDWVATASTAGSIIKTTPMSKVTDSSVHANYTSGPSSILYASVWSNWHLDESEYTNVTVYNSAHPNYPLTKGASNYIDVLNHAHEIYGDCMTQLRFQTNASGTHSGRWRTDY